MKVLGISGSLRRDSYNTMLLRNAAALFGDEVEFVEWDALREIPPYDGDDDVTEAPAAVARLREAVADADAVFIATPEYNHSVPGQLKNGLDWVSRPYATNPARNKPAAVVGASTGAFGAAWAQAEVRKILACLGARVLENGVTASHAPTRFDEDGTLVDEELRAELGEVVESLVAAAEERAGLIQAAA